jgi:hypothetical protein
LQKIIRDFFIGLNNIVSESMLIPLIYQYTDFLSGTMCTRKGNAVAESCGQNLQKRQEKEREKGSVLL